MKHPILYRVVFYSAFATLSVGFLFSISLLSDAPFKSSDMKFAYQGGCNWASRPLTDEKIKSCEEMANTFGETLDDLDRQMEAIDVAH